MSAALLVLAVAATVRLTRLVTSDYLTEHPRRWLQAHLPEPLAYLLGCPWCASIYVGGLVAAVTVVWPTNRLVVGLWLALAGSLAAGLVALVDHPEDFGE